MTRSPRRSLPWLLALALAIRLVAHARAMMMMNDGPDFLWQAERFLAGEWYVGVDHPYHPGYGAAIAALVWLTRLPVETAAIAISIASGLAIVLAVWATARLLFPDEPRAADLAGVVAAILPPIAMFTSDVQSDGLFLALVSGSLWALLAGIRRGGDAPRLALSGALAGAGFLTRPEGLLLCGAVALWVVLPSASARLPRRLLGLAAFAVALVLVATPYVTAIRALTGAWGVSMKPSVSATGLTDGETVRPPPRGSPLASPEVDRDNDLRNEIAGEDASDLDEDMPALHRMLDDEGPAGRLAYGLASGLREFVLALGPVLLFLVPGFLLLRRRVPRLTAILVATCALGFAALALHVARSDYLSMRHTMILLALVLPVSGAGLLWLWRAGTPGSVARLALRTLVVLSMVYLLLNATRERRENKGERLAALAWVAERTGPLDRIVVPRRRDGWYADRPVLLLPLPTDERDLKRAMRATGAVLMVMDVEDIERWHPDWLQPDAPFEEVARFDDDDESTDVVVLRPARRGR